MSSLAVALADLQADPPKIRKAARGQVGTREVKYATLDAIWAALAPWRQEHGIIWVCCPSRIDGAPVLTYRLVHVETGEEINGHYPLTEGHGQALGADITYARRYALCAVLGLLAEDDTDGQPIERRQRTAAKVTGPEHERLRHGTVEPTPEDRPAERQKAGGQPPVDMWMDNPPGEFDIGTPEDRPGSIDPRQLRDLQIAFKAAGIEDRAVRLGMTADMIGREVLTAKQLSRLEADYVIKTLKARQGEARP
jgi:hypothetical protein